MSPVARNYRSVAIGTLKESQANEETYMLILQIIKALLEVQKGGDTNADNAEAGTAAFD